jgi:hypothetical protein
VGGRESKIHEYHIILVLVFFNILLIIKRIVNRLNSIRKIVTLPHPLVWKEHLIIVKFDYFEVFDYPAGDALRALATVFFNFLLNLRN